MKENINLEKLVEDYKIKNKKYEQLKNAESLTTLSQNETSKVNVKEQVNIENDKYHDFILQLGNVLKSVDMFDYENECIVYKKGEFVSVYKNTQDFQKNIEKIMQPNSSFFHTLYKDIKNQINKQKRKVADLYNVMHSYGVNKEFYFSSLNMNDRGLLDNLSNLRLKALDDFAASYIDDDFVDMHQIDLLVDEYGSINNIYNKANNFMNLQGDRTRCFADWIEDIVLWATTIIDIMENANIDKMNGFNALQNHNVQSCISLEKIEDTWYMTILKNQYYDKDLRFKICIIDRHGKKIDVMKPKDFNGNVAMFKVYTILGFQNDAERFEEQLSGKIKKKLVSLNEKIDALTEDTNNKDDMDYEK